MPTPTAKFTPSTDFRLSSEGASAPGAETGSRDFQNLRGDVVITEVELATCGPHSLRGASHQGGRGLTVPSSGDAAPATKPG